MMQTYLIGVDIGTQGTKAALFDQDIGLIATAFEASRLISPKPGVVWQEPEEMLGACCRTIRELMEKSGVKPSSIAAIGLDGQMAGIMGIDKKGDASTYYDSWLDMRCGPFMDEMNEKAGQLIIELSGGPATYVHGPKILWWKNMQPEAYRDTAKFVLPHAYIVGKMCNLGAEQAYFDYTHLHFSCLSDNKNKRWSQELLETFGIDAEKMPRIVSPFEIVGTLSEEFAGRCGLVSGIPMTAGCGDTAASTFGSGMFEPGLVLDIAGTASVLCSVVDRYNPDVANKTLTMMRSPVEGLFLPLAYVNGGGQCVRWFRDMLANNKTVSYEQLQSEAEPISCGSEGLIFIPHFSGRVLPNNSHLKGSFLGLDFKHTRGHLYRSILESIAYEYDYYLSVLKKLYPDIAFSRLLSLGGGAKSSLFSQIKADVLGLDVLTLKLGETALIGSAVIAGVGVGMLKGYADPIRKAIEPGNSYHFDAESHEFYKPYVKAYLESIDSMTTLYKNSAVLGKA